MKEKEEDELAMFLEMQEDNNKKDEKNDDFLFLLSSDELDASLGSKHKSSPILKKIMSSPKARRTVDDKNDYNWLLTPPGAPFISTLDMELEKTSKSQDETPITCPAKLNSRFGNYQVEPTSKVGRSSKQNPSPGSNSSSSESCRPSSSGSQVSATSKRETPIEHRIVPNSNKPSRLLKPSLRATLPSTKSKLPTTRSSSRTSTPTARPTVPACKSKLRSGTPTREPSTPLAVSSVSVPPGRSSSVGRLGPKPTRSVATSRASPIVKSRPQNSLEKPGFSTNAPQNSRGSTTKRSVSNPRCGNGTIDSKARPRQCSPSRGPDPKGSAYRHGSSFPAVSRAFSNDGDNVSPLLYGTKMVERVVNMRKLAPPKQELTNHSAGKSSSHNSSGFGRTLSKSSLDMALRHMDIGRSKPCSLRPLVTREPASTMYSSERPRSRADSVTDSPLAPSSIASSDLNENSTPIDLDSSEADFDLDSEKREMILGC
ncbi:flocculation FLO11-like protein [Thalictrum thalictroides]|uniref:Flocculation FLO11-like protein n=1 Tax=Thalictrum thalictroides TaxID=46969 RepID=A0A7J6VU40_THATH|nr:flocculation FLO11-like protein [Thalictrum thalictroides]